MLQPGPSRTRGRIPRGRLSGPGVALNFAAPGCHGPGHLDSFRLRSGESARMRCRFCVRSCGCRTQEYQSHMNLIAACRTFILFACAARWAFTKSMVVFPTRKDTFAVLAKSALSGTSGPMWQPISQCVSGLDDSKEQAQGGLFSPQDQPRAPQLTSAQVSFFLQTLSIVTGVTNHTTLLSDVKLSEGSLRSCVCSRLQTSTLSHKSLSTSSHGER